MHFFQCINWLTLSREKVWSSDKVSGQECKKLVGLNAVSIKIQPYLFVVLSTTTRISYVIVLVINRVNKSLDIK